MNKLLVLALLILATITSPAQSFEGKITYTLSYKSNISQMTDAQWSSMMGSVQEYYIKGGNYKSVLNGTIMQWQLYSNAENRLYSKMSNSETAFWNDGSSNPDVVLEVKLNRNAIDILGYNCDELILICKSGVQKYYFSSKLAVDFLLYEKHKFGNWYDYLKESKAVPLKSISQNAQFTMESVAVEVKEMKLNEEVFQLPQNTKTAKSPY